MKVTAYTSELKKTTATISDGVFTAPVNKQLLSQAIKVYLSNLRQGTNKVKARGEVNRTKAKWYKQKHTGKARHGSRNAPIFVGGGVAFGPEGLTDYSRSLSKTMKAVALMSALSAQASTIKLVDKLSDLNGKTRDAASMLKAIGIKDEKVLVVMDKTVANTVRSLQNIENVMLTKTTRLTALEVAHADVILMTKEAVSELEKKLESYVKVAPTKAKAVKNEDKE